MNLAGEYYCSGSPVKGVFPITIYSRVTPADQISILYPWCWDLNKTWRKGRTFNWNYRKTKLCI